MVAVGGTTLNLNFLLGNFVTETAWSGSGGGTSRSSSPSRLIRTSSRRPESGPSPTSPSTPTPTLVSPFTTLITKGRVLRGPGPEGTSLATPCWAGLIAIANQGRVALGLQTLNTTDPTEALQAIYSLPNSDFRDITSGSNGAYSAGPGYDEVTGRGSPIVNSVITDLARYMSPPLVVAGSAAPVSATGATLNASVQMPAYFGSSYFQYSTNPTFTPTVQANLGSGFNFPGAVAVDGAGDVFVADTGNNAVKEILPGGTIKTIGSGFNTPEGVAVDRFGDVLVADTGNNAVKVVFPNGAISTIGSGFSDPIGVAVDRAGDVFVADYGHNAVKEIQVGGAIRTIGSGFSRPFGVALDAAGDVYVADTGNNAVKEVLPNGTIKTIGSGFNSPTGVAVDGSGDVFVADFRNNAVKEVLPGGTIQPIGSGFLGAAGVAVDGAGDVFVADYGHNQVVRLSPGQVGANPQNQDAGQGSVLIQGTLLGLNPGTTYYFRAVAAGGVGGGTTVGPSGSFTTLALPTVTTGTSSAVGATGATVSGTVNPNGTTASTWFQYSTDPSLTPTVRSTIGSGFSHPDGVAANAAGYIAVADTGNSTVKLVTPGGSVVTFLDPFSGPTGVAIDSAGDIFVADTGHNAVEEFQNLGPIRTLGSGFSHPEGVAVDALGDVFVADTGNNAVKEILPNGTIKTIGAGFNDPSGVAVDGLGDVFVADTGNKAVKEVLPNGTIQIVGSGFLHPYSVAVDATGDVYVTDTGHNALKEVLPNGTIKTVGSGFSAVQGVGVDPFGNVYVADAGQSSLVELSIPTVAGSPASLAGTAATPVSAPLTGLNPGTTYYYRAIVTSPSGNAFGLSGSFSTLAPPLVTTGTAVSISATGATIEATVNPDGHSTTALVQYSTDPSFPITAIIPLGPGSPAPEGVAVDGSGDVFVADYYSSTIQEVLPNGTINSVGHGFGSPTGVAVDAQGDVFVADFRNNAVDEVLPNGTIKPIQPIGSGYDGPTGVAVDGSGDVFVANYDNGLVMEVLPNGHFNVIGHGFSSPKGVAVDGAGDVFVADSGNNAVEEVLPNGTIQTVGSGFSSPQGVAVDGSGDVFVADYFSRAIQEVLPNGTITPIGSGFSSPLGVAVDGLGDVFVADSGNHAVKEVMRPTAAVTPSPLTGTAALADSAALVGLTPGTTYFYRVVATNSYGTTIATAGSFTTLTLPVVTTSAAGAISQSGATLNGTVNPNGATTTTWFQYSTSPSFTPTVQTTLGAGFSLPTGVAVDAAGDVFVADRGNNARQGGAAQRHHQDHRLRVQLPVRGGGGRGRRRLRRRHRQQRRQGGAAQRDHPDHRLRVQRPVRRGGGRGLGDVFVADTGNNAVKEVLPNGTIKTIGGGFKSPGGVAVDAAGNVFVADFGHNAVEEVLPNGTILTIGAGFNDPSGVAVDGLGDVFVADTGNSAVKEVLPNGTILTIGSGFSYPYGVAVDATGDVFVADYLHNRVIEVSPPTVSATPSPLTGTAVTAVSGTLTGLLPGTTYYFRAVGSSPGGTVVGPTESFTTLSILGGGDSIVAAPSASSPVIGSDGRAGQDGDHFTSGSGGATRSNQVRPGGHEANGVVNLLDLNRVLQAVLTDQSYDIFADLNGDGVVDAAESVLALKRADSQLR